MHLDVGVGGASTMGEGHRTHSAIRPYGAAPCLFLDLFALYSTRINVF